MRFTRPSGSNRRPPKSPRSAAFIPAVVKSLVNSHHQPHSAQISGGLQSRFETSVKPGANYTLSNDDRRRAGTESL